MEVSSWTGGN
uniref:Uncharacterized protein n=1 Tax=Anguilla anguilla TaxID=7936 RepID=A0A0E9U4X8_ANGAN